MVYIFRATAQHSEVLLHLIKELAEYEGMLDKVVGTTDNINKTLFCENPKVEALLLKGNDDRAEIIGFAIYFYNYSTFLCKHGIYIENIYVCEKYRSRDFEKKFSSIYTKKPSKKTVVASNGGV